MDLRLLSAYLLLMTPITLVIQWHHMGKSPAVICNLDELKAADSSKALHKPWMKVLEKWEIMDKTCKMTEAIRIIMTEKTALFQQCDDHDILIWCFPSFLGSACQSDSRQTAELIPKSWRKLYRMPQGYKVSPADDDAFKGRRPEEYHVPLYSTRH